MARSGAAVKARRARMVVWNCIMYLTSSRAADFGVGKGEVCLGGRRR